jgi:hypothetical protein
LLWAEDAELRLDSLFFAPGPARRPGVHDSVIATVAVLLFLGLDIGFVVVALLWLSERRALDDKTDQRNRKRPIKYR